MSIEQLSSALLEVDLISCCCLFVPDYRLLQAMQQVQEQTLSVDTGLLHSLMFSFSHLNKHPDNWVRIGRGPLSSFSTHV